MEPRLLLADFIRDDLGFTGTHLGCEHGVCGACTVQMDGEAVRSVDVRRPSQWAPDRDRRGDGAVRQELHPLQQAFHEFHALQCGFCTPGILMTMSAFLRSEPDPTADQVRTALSGNLCRCTGYQNIVTAVLEAAKRMREDTASPLHPRSEEQQMAIYTEAPKAASNRVPASKIDVVDLSQPFSMHTPGWVNYPSPKVSYFQRHHTHGIVSQWLETSLHVSTHMDGDVYAVPGGRDIAAMPLDLLVQEAIFVDIREECKEFTWITPEMLTSKMEIKKGDIVIIHTGGNSIIRTTPRRTTSSTSSSPRRHSRAGAVDRRHGVVVGGPGHRFA